jgi:hypothetical protein
MLHESKALQRVQMKRPSRLWCAAPRRKTNRSEGPTLCWKRLGLLVSTLLLSLARFWL